MKVHKARFRASTTDARLPCYGDVTVTLQHDGEGCTMGLRRRFWTWLFHRVERHRHGPTATRRDRLKCDLYDLAAGMPARHILRERLRGRGGSALEPK